MHRWCNGYMNHKGNKEILQNLKQCCFFQNKAVEVSIQGWGFKVLSQWFTADTTEITVKVCGKILTCLS